MTPVLGEVRVVDLSWGLSGSVAAQILAEVGADVVKIEPAAGDPMRRLHPSAFATWNRSKRSRVLGLDTPEFRALLGGADVLIHSMRPSTAARHGLDDATLTTRYPRLVVCAVTGYPSGHADVERPGYDLLVQAREGLMDVQSGWHDGPFVWRFPMPSWGAAYLAAAGVAARLFHRERTGRGGVAHTSLAQGAHLFQNLLWTRAERPSPSLLEGQPGTLVATQVAMYECADGQWLQILNPADRVDLSTMPLMQAALAEAGRADVPFDADVMRTAMRLRPASDWLAAIRSLDVAVELISAPGEILRDPDVLANDFVVEVDDPEHGRLRQAAPPFRSDVGWTVQGPAPTLDQHPHAGTEWTPRPAVESGHDRAADEAPLAGVRVVDFGAYLAGPLAPMLLADLGADVVKVEPVTGDPVRGWRDTFFVACNRGKRGLALDISAGGGRAVVERLVRESDVVHHNLRTRAAGRLGLDRDAIRAINPRAVFSHVSAYGLAGERADWPGYDSVFQAMAGWPLAVAGAGNPPLFVHLGTLDVLTGVASTVATLLALYHRERTGLAVGTESALLNTATFSTSETALRLTDDTLLPVSELDAAQLQLGPGYGVHATLDADLVAAVAPDDDTRAALDAVLAAGAPAGRGTAEFVEALARAGVPAETVRPFRFFDVWDDPENRRTRTVVSYPQADWGEMEQFGAYWELGDLPLALERACPAVGQHTREVLSGLGLTVDAVDALLAGGLALDRQERSPA